MGAIGTKPIKHQFAQKLESSTSILSQGTLNKITCLNSKSVRRLNQRFRNPWALRYAWDATALGPWVSKSLSYLGLGI